MSGIKEKKILLLSPSLISEDPRVLAHLKVLREFGHVTTAGFGSQPDLADLHLEVDSTARWLPVDVLSLVRIALRLYKSASRATRFNNAVREAISERNFDLVVANDVHSLVIAKEVADYSCAPLWVDMHEYAPRESENDWRWRLLYQKYVAWICSNVLPKAHIVTTVSEGIKSQYEIDSCRPVELVRNTSSFVQRQSAQGALIGRIIRLVHVGAAIRARDLTNMIHAVRGLYGFHLDLYLVPTDQQYYNELVAITTKIPNVSVMAPVSLNELVPTIANYHCGIVTIPPTNFNYQNGLPNKLFQYVQARLPIVTGPIAEISQIVGHYGIGWVTADFSSESIRETLLNIRSDDLVSMSQKLDIAAAELSQENENIKRYQFVNALLEG